MARDFEGMAGDLRYAFETTRTTFRALVAGAGETSIPTSGRKIFVPAGSGPVVPGFVTVSACG